MRYALMEAFQMHHSDTWYGVRCPNRMELFRKASELGFDGVELGLDLDYAQDPLWTGEGNFHQQIRDVVRETGVEARSLCLHLLNYQENSPGSEEAAHRATARRLLEGVCEFCHAIGASVILVPFFGTATLRTEAQIQYLSDEMCGLAPVAESFGVCVALETSLDAPTTRRLIEQIDSDAVQVYFDTGNTAGFDYDVPQEIEALAGLIVQAHIKDYPTTPVLGNGEIDFPQAIEALCQTGFQDYLVLETPTSDDVTMQANLAYLRQIVEA